MDNAEKSKEQQIDMVWCAGRWRLSRRCFVCILPTLRASDCATVNEISRLFQKQEMLGREQTVDFVSQWTTWLGKTMPTSGLNYIDILPKSVNVKQDTGVCL